MFIKKTIIRLYALYLMRRWHMKNLGSMALAGVFIDDYRKHKGQWLTVFKVHRHGFALIDWMVNNLTSDNCIRYLKTVSYYGMHPLNERYSQWIDDKLTLKYLCAGKVVDKYMPEYYFHIDAEGRVLRLPDQAGGGIADINEIIDRLKENKELALKRVAGSLGEGFYKLAWDGKVYTLNSETLSEYILKKKIAELREYLITEYFHPHEDMVQFSADTVNTIRYLMARDGHDWRMIRSFIRFGTKQSGFVENYNAGGVLCYISETGNFANGNVYNFATEKNQIVKQHPDTGVFLKGKIPLWKELKKAAEDFCQQFPQLKYLGIDFVVTSKNQVKILEINSLTSLDSLQLEGSILEMEGGKFYQKNYLK